MGCTGGTKKGPAYQDLGDHSEAIQIDYDPTRISYEQLLVIFWSTHNSCSRPGSRQYRSAIFYHNEEQKRLSLQTKAREETRRGKIHTEIEPAAGFYLAEDYHQKFQLRQTEDLMKEFSVIYPRDKNFVASTAAARVNGYLGGNGTPETFKAGLDLLGLSPMGKKKLLERVPQLKQ